MRDLVLAPIIIWLCFSALRRPWVGVMGWTWISMMNPHAYAWTLNSLPVAAAIAGCTLLGAIVTKDKRDFSLTPEMSVLIAFMCWMCITLPFSFNFDDSYLMWKRVMKIDFMVLVTLVLLYTKKHLITFIWVVVGSIGFYGVKGGLFTIATGGAYRVWGPTGTYIDGNNEVALALIIITPLFRFLQLQLTSKWGKRAITVSILLCAAAALGSHSRGALLALAAMAGALWWFGGRQIGVLIGIVVAAFVALAFMPEEWFSRMNTISEYQADTSAMGRINAWYMAWNLAKDNFFGGGFEIYNRMLFGMYAPDPDAVHAAHSIYFQVLGEHGFVGLILFLTLWALVWWNAGKLRKEAKKQPETKWVSDLGAMCQVSLVGYAVGGAFLSLAYFDLPYNIMIMVVLARRWVARKGWLEENTQGATLATETPPKLKVP
ncbi:MAG: putative O-glycosylation ligase, exosortase A system-associated [Azonexus sp.]|nr:putative O-glycosylation ligase, exosortase A system-associated [Azonexus sp.]